MFYKIAVLKNFAIFTGQHLCWSHFLIKLEAWSSATSLKRDSSTDVLLRILRNFKNIFLKGFANGCFYTCERLRLNIFCVKIEHRWFWLSGNHAILSLTQETRNWVDSSGSQALRKGFMYIYTEGIPVSIYLLKLNNLRLKKA